MKKWQISKPKIVDWYLDFSNESYTTLKSVISSLKICFQNYGQLKRKCLRASMKPGTWNIPEHAGTSRNIPEHEKIKVIFMKKN